MAFPTRTSLKHRDGSRKTSETIFLLGPSARATAVVALVASSRYARSNKRSGRVTPATLSISAISAHQAKRVAC